MQLNFQERGLYVRALIYGSLIVYLISDLVLFRGPLSRFLKQRDLTPQDLPADVVAVAGRRAILGSDVQEAVKIYLFRRGQNVDDQKPERLQELRRIVLSSLIEDKLVAYRADQIPVEIEEGDWGNLRVQYQDLIQSFPAFEKRLHREHHERRWIEAKTADWRQVSDDEVNLWRNRWASAIDADFTEEVHVYLRNEKASAGTQALIKKLRETSDIIIAWDQL